MTENNDYVRAHFKELRTKYPGMYLAISDDKIIATGTTASEVLKGISKQDLKKIRFVHIPKSKVVFYRC